MLTSTLETLYVASYDSSVAKSSKWETATSNRHGISKLLLSDVKKYVFNKTTRNAILFLRNAAQIINSHLTFARGYHLSDLTERAASPAEIARSPREASTCAHASWIWFEHRTVPCILKIYGDEWFCIAVCKDEAFRVLTACSQEQHGHRVTLVTCFTGGLGAGCKMNFLRPLPELLVDSDTIDCHCIWGC